MNIYWKEQGKDSEERERVMEETSERMTVEKIYNYHIYTEDIS
jgi:hypothetical protein